MRALTNIPLLTDITMEETLSEMVAKAEVVREAVFQRKRFENRRMSIQIFEIGK